MNRQPVPLDKAYLLMNHGPVTLVSSAHGERRNVMAASWTMSVDFSPPKIAVVIDATSFTRQLVDASSAFVLNIPCRRIAAQVLAVGSVSGRDGDKFAACGVAVIAEPAAPAPLIAGCAAWLACRVIDEPDNHARHDLFVAEVTAAWADADIFSNGRWHFPDDASRTVHYLAGGNFLASGEAFAVDA